jgi:superfamily II DNA or RNA helicase
MGLKTWNTPKKLYFYEMDGKNLIVPYGVCGNILRFALIARASITQNLAPIRRVDFKTNIPLRDYQEEAVKGMMKCRNGILQSPPGSGKTRCAIALIVRRGVKTLWLTHTHDLLRQSYLSAKEFIDESLLGIIEAGKVQIGEGITFATVQTLEKQDLQSLKNTWNCIVVDECHRCVQSPTSATMFQKVLNNLSATYKYGLSATVHRADGLIMGVFALLGQVQYTVPDEAVADSTMQVKVVRVNTGFYEFPEEALDTDGTINHAKMLNALAVDGNRNLVILKKLLANAEHYNLILSDRIAHLRCLYNALPGELRKDAAVIDGSMTSKKKRAEREQAIEDMRTGKKHFLFASYSLAKEGLDIPRLDRLHLVTPQKDYAVITQSIGRVARVFEGKGQPIIYDYVDRTNKLERMYRKRVTSYKKAHCEIVTDE